MNIDVLEMMLTKKLEREVLYCLSGEDAIRNIREKAEQSRDVQLKLLVLMDINMPCMDGVATTRIIKRMLQSYRNVEATFIALTAQEEKSIKEIDMFNGYRTKPITKDALEDTILFYGF